MNEMKDPKGFLAALFDLSFSDFITVKIIKILFLIAIVLSAFAALAVVIAGIAGGVATGLVALIVSPFVFLLNVLWARIYLELIMVAFRIAENTQKMADAKKSKAPAVEASEK